INMTTPPRIPAIRMRVFMAKLQPRRREQGRQKPANFSACSTGVGSTFSTFIQLNQLHMKTSVLTLITALATVAFLSSCAQKKEEPMAASTASTTHASTTKKSSTTKKTSSASAEASPAAKKKSTAKKEASPAAS